MARTTGSEGGKTEAAIRIAAASLIARHGFEAVAMRQLASEVGVQAAALYRYFPNKQDLLFKLMARHMEELLSSWEAKRAQAGLEPASRLADFVEHHIRFHLERRETTHVSNLELRSLSEGQLPVILDLRSRYEAQLRTILQDGMAAGRFTIEDAGLTTMAIIQMITGVIVWYRPQDRLSVDELIARYLIMTLRLVGAAPHH
ncbi:TetR/AcrR family transcriptional regulator [Tianweitania sediminis]|uniref:TetR family transcriptional regulator n=1 Tax=Tianweitania sediminis TaxID=1502156 RepID=A0A8J7UL25_9HYPH|nr:TetR/AcrR family transcriptional regulator [Tianweitania sediminis]MBP0438937.1 TetR family transcriptional regulator [Tianweitania sediminis]HEV7416335.1 TetR/AcrR family transcriptional regulator [Tianweitania sediminis]